MSKDKKKQKQHYKKTLNSFIQADSKMFSDKLNDHFEHLKKVKQEGLKDIISQAQRYKNNTLQSRTGFVAEADHCATFNHNSALKGLNTKCTREANGKHGDYKLVNTDHNKVVRKGEVKYYKNAEATEQAMRGYDNRQLVGPKEQVKEIKEIAARKAAKNFAKGRPNRTKVAIEHEKVGENVNDRIEYGEISSEPRTLKQEKNITQKATKGTLTEEDIYPSPSLAERLSVERLKNEAFSGAKTGGKAGAFFSATTSMYKNIKAVKKGKKDEFEAIIDTVKDTAKGTVEGAAKGAASKVATVVAKEVAERVEKTVLKSTLKSNAPAVIAIGAIDCGKSVVKYIKGEIEGKELKKEIAKTTVTTATSYAGAEIGAAIGSAICPVVGTFVGSIVGGIVGSMVPSAFD